MPVYDPAAREQFRQTATVAPVSRNKGRRYSVDNPQYAPPPRRNSRNALLEDKQLLKPAKHGSSSRHGSLTPLQWLNAMAPSTNDLFSKSNGTNVVQTLDVVHDHRHRASMPEMLLEAVSTRENSPCPVSDYRKLASISSNAKLAENAHSQDAKSHNR